MSTDVTARRPRDRLHWAHGESLVIAGTRPFWVDLAAVLPGLAALFGVGLQRIGRWSRPPVPALLEPLAVHRPAFSTILVAAIGRNVVLEDGTLVIDHRGAAAR